MYVEPGEILSLSQTYEQFPLGPLTADKCGKYAAVWALRAQTPGLNLFISQRMFSVDQTRSARALEESFSPRNEKSVMTSLFEITSIVQRQRRQPLSDESTSRCSGSQSDRLRNGKHSHRARNVVKRIFFPAQREKSYKGKALLAISIRFNIW